MNFFKKLINFFFTVNKKNKDSYNREISEPESSAEDNFFKVSQENNTDKSSSAESSLHEDKPFEQTKLKYKKTTPKKKVKISPAENKKKIKKIKSEDDLYELFTGKKNPEVYEYKPAKDDGSKELNFHEKFKLYPPPEKTVDLHNLRSFEAEIKIENTVVSARIKGIKTVCFITGKGTHSANNDSVLKKLAESMAVEYKKKGEIFTFRWEKKKKKKSGAIIFYL
ncbi:MAG: Smr/MutS family protein [Candidatus Muiribacteriota bacterium]